MTRIRTLMGSALLLAGLSACAAAGGDGPGSAPAPASRETISYSIGPCFGFCPVYTAAIAPDGKVHFDGARHTAVLGARDIRAAPSAFAAVSAALADYRPATGTTAETQCEQQISDQQHTTITWTAADGTKTVLEHDKGCRSARNEKLNAVIGELPAKLGIADLAKQQTRPGASRS